MEIASSKSKQKGPPDLGLPKQADPASILAAAFLAPDNLPLLSAHLDLGFTDI